MLSETTDTLSPAQACLILNALRKIGPVTIKKLLEHYDGDVLRILKAEEKELARLEDIGKTRASMISRWEESFDLAREESLLERHGAEFVTHASLDYPKLLREIYDAPVGLYFKGQGRPKGICVGIVGTRRPTVYGRAIAHQLGRELSARGIWVVSGLARGIDTAAHEGALEGGGNTIAILGCGADIIYPPENIQIYKEIVAKGAVVSEFPFGRRADKQTFPMRNRLISGMCHAVIVVESAENGGSMITARFAGEHGRQVFAVPGRIDQPASAGCHALIKDGATLLTSVDDVIESLRFSGQGEFAFESDEECAPLRAKPLPPDLTGNDLAVMKMFDRHDQISGDLVADSLNLSVVEVFPLLMMLELKGLVTKRVDGHYIRA